MVFVLKRDVLSIVGPVDGPARLLHGSDEGGTGYGYFLGFQHRLVAIDQIGSFHFSDHGLVFFLVPGNPFALFKPAAVKVFSFFRYGQATVPAHLIHHLFHGCQVFGCGVQLMAVLVADCVGYHVEMKMATVLMDGHQNLVTGKFLFCELLAKGQQLLWRDFFILVER